MRVRRVVLFLVWMLVGGRSLQGFGQSTRTAVQGLATDSASLLPLVGVTVTVLEELHSIPVLSDSSGRFRLLLSPGHYRLRLQYVGYRDQSLAIEVGATATTIRPIRLVAEYGNLSTVIVTAQKKLIENKIDRIVFNAENDLTSQGGVATDILKKIPQVSVDVDGNVELAGSSSIRFLINGKSSTTFGSNIADVLQSIPASQISRIEVMTTPGAKYDAEGLGGVINIILKQDPSKGFNSSLSLTAGSRIENGSLNVNARTSKWSINLFSSYNTRLAAKTGTNSLRHSFDSSGTTILQQQLEGTFKRYGSESGIGAEWSPDKKNTVSAGAHYNLFGNTNEGTILANQTVTDTGSAPLYSSFENISQSAFRFHSVDVNLNYHHGFSKPEQTLEAAINSSFGNGRPSSAYQQFGEPDKLFQSGNSSVNPGTQRETEITIDYSTPVGQSVKWGSGAKTTLADISSAVQSFALAADGSQTPDPNLSSQLDYHQKIYAAYTEVEAPVKKWFSVKGGLRYERTQVSGDYFTPARASVTQGYNTLVPSVYLSRPLGEDQQIKLGYTRRIERPDIGNLNPFINTSDPKNLTTGNPALRPEQGQRLELTYTKNIHPEGSISCTLFYRSNTDDIQPYVTYYTQYQVGDTVFQNVNVSKNQNIGLEKNLGVNLFADVTLFAKLSIRSDLFFFHRFTTNLIDRGYNIQSNNYRINVNLAYRFSKNLAAEFFGNFRSPRNEVQGRYPSFTTYSFAMRKQIWNKKASIALTFINPFNRYVRQETNLFGPTFQLQSIRNIPFRSIGVNFIWRFGKLEFKKKEVDNSLPGTDS